MVCNREEVDNLCICYSLRVRDVVTSLSLTVKYIPSAKGSI